MTWLWRVVAVCLTVQVINSKPHHAKRAHRIKKTIRPCVQVATAAGEILDFANAAFSLQPGEFQEMADTFSDIDIFDQSERERVLCRLEGLSTLSDFLEAVADLGLDYNALKVAYDYFSVIMRVSKYHAQEDIDNNHELDDPHNNRLEIELIENFEAFGFFGLDPTREQAMTDIITTHMPINFNLPLMEPLSTLPLDAQCTQLTNSLRELWNMEMRQTTNSNPNASAEVQEVIRRWTGIVIIDQESLKYMICDLMGRIDSDGLEGIYDWVVDMMIMNYTLKQGYPYIQDDFQHTQSCVQIALANYPGNYSDGSYSGGHGGPGYGGPDYGGPSREEMIQMYINQAIVLDNLELMGLVSLTDDLRK